MAPRMQTKSSKRISEKGRVLQTREYSQLGHPQPHRHRSTAHRTPSSRAPSTQPAKRSRTISQGAPPLRGILKNKNAPPMQASASMQHSRGGGNTMSQPDYHAGHHPSGRDGISRYPYAHVHNGANAVAPPLERSRSTHVDTTRSRPQYQPSDSPVSDDSDQGNNPPVALLQVRASNYISAYVRPGTLCGSSDEQPTEE
ncbi:hypothetical protein JOM56_014493 [Amanita muscaria]